MKSACLHRPRTLFIRRMNIQKMLQQVQQMQGQMQKTQAELGSKTFEATVAGGRVTVTANGHGDIQGVKISREVVDPADVEVLQDLVLSAIQQVQQKVKESQAAEMGKLTGGLGLPPGMGFLSLARFNDGLQEAGRITHCSCAWGACSGFRFLGHLAAQRQNARLAFGVLGLGDLVIGDIHLAESRPGEQVVGAKGGGHQAGSDGLLDAAGLHQRHAQRVPTVEELRVQFHAATVERDGGLQIPYSQVTAGFVKKGVDGFRVHGIVQAGDDPGFTGPVRRLS